MNSVALFSALSQAIFTSIGQALIIYIFLRFLLFVFKDLDSSWRYNIYYTSLALICTGFILSFIGYYSSALLLSVSVSTGNLTGTAVSNTGWFAVTKPYSFWIAWIYLGGLIVQSFSLLFAFYRLKFKTLKNYLPAPGHWTVRFEALKQKLQISKNVTLHFSNEVVIPFTAGFLKPVILFPMAIVSRLSTDQVEAILLHELVHIKRHDYLLNIVQRIMEVILFFNPVTWLLAKEIRLEREYCCDAIVLQHTQMPADYARALAFIEEHRLNINSIALAVSGNKKHDLLTRIQKITNMKPQNPNSKQRLVALLSILAISLSLAWVIPADTTKNKQNKTEIPAIQPVTPAVPLVDPPAPPPVPALIEPMKPVQAPLPPAIDLPAVPLPPAPIDTNELKKSFNSADWKKEMERMKLAAEEMKKQFSSPEWKQQLQDMKLASEEMKKQFNSPEWKKQVEKMKISGEGLKKQFDSSEWKKQMEDLKAETQKMSKQFNSPEWKKQIEEMKVDAEKMKKQFDSPEWKKQIEEMKVDAEKMKKQFESPEWKKQIEEMKVDAEKTKKQFDSPEWKKKVKELELKEESNK